MAGKDKVVNTKIYRNKFDTIKAITEKSGISIFRFLQTVLDCFYKCFCDGEPITEETREIISKFIDFERTKNGFSLIAPNKRDIRFSKCLAILNVNGKEIPELLLLEKDGDNITENLNRDRILIEFLSAFSPPILRKLKSIQKAEKTRNLIDALNLAVFSSSDLPEDTLHNEIMELFEESDNIVLSADLKHNNTDNLPSGAFDKIGKYKRPYTLTKEMPIQERGEDGKFLPLEYVESLQETETED